MTNPLSPRERVEAVKDMMGDQSSTYQGRHPSHDTEPAGGRWGGVSKPISIAEGGMYPRLPDTHQIWAGDQPEPLIDASDTGDTYDGTLTRGVPDEDTMALHSVSGQSAPVPSPIDGASPAGSPLAVETPQLVSPPSLSLSPVAGDVGQSGIGVKAGPLTPEQDQAMRQFVKRRRIGE